MKNKKLLKQWQFWVAMFAVLGILILVMMNVNGKAHFTIYKNDIKVDEITACCLELGESSPPKDINWSNIIGSRIDKSDYNAIFCFPKENLKYFKVPCESLKKEDLIIEWFDWNAECIEVYDKDKREKVSCGKNEKYLCTAFTNRPDFFECSKYKFGEHLIETWEQIK